ncbi:P-loop containing nucleoside triphosphate hydrolase protein [Daldinia loculata]|uniref:P-loop containing nucleoside triphosphate hydrolase protein n=1 Tax=Daldinia loculata TaxID=103429 RepID=UPI0020C318C4|nr:P-loop containing nucleoside triphosphate hydrolase protein [Daldinia loculata]KAI1650814.1 P-loop containing nucleoside triphosphate hydrolase protein [Daldinia loculata]
MGSIEESTMSEEKSNLGNLSILTKVDKLRELIGTKIALPQLVVVGDQSSGKSSVLEGLTHFGFPRDAELCTRYATQITCRREKEESIHVSIIPHDEASTYDQARIKKFHRSLKAITPESLAQLFMEANEAMGIKSSTKSTSPDGSSLPAFSEHILKIEKLGPEEDHFTVIDVPGIFRKETEGVTTEADIELVMNMVKNYMKDPRTIILAIMPSNVDPATQEILKLAKKADPSMTRTMAVLTKPDLAIESTMQQIAIDHVTGRRGDLLLGYYIVKNRGPDDAHKTLRQGQADEKRFFSQAPWSSLRNTERAGVEALKKRVRELLVELIKKEFPKLKADVAKELSALRSELNKMGQSRGHQHTQRAYLNKISEAFQALVRDALNAYYTGNKMFEERHDLRLITRIVEANESYSDVMLRNGHTWPFAPDLTPEEKGNEKVRIPVVSLTSTHVVPNPDDGTYPELEEILDDSLDVIMEDVSGEGDIMDYIAGVYKDSRGQDLGTFGVALVSTMFKEQSKKWKYITLDYVNRVIWIVHHFIVEAIKETCPDKRVREELWNGHLLDELQDAYRKAIDHVMFLLEIERDGPPLTLNHYFNDTLQKAQSGRLVDALRQLGSEKMVTITDGTKLGNTSRTEKGIFLSDVQMNNLSFNMANSEHVQEYMHDILKSYYKVSRKRFVDVVCQQVVNHYLLQGKCSPLKIFNTEMVLNLTEEQLDMIAAEDTPVKRRREKLGRDITNFQEALKVLKGSG